MPNSPLRLLPLFLVLGAFSANGGNFSILHPFTLGPGCQPESTLVETSLGVFYGTTSNCGPSLFSITSSGIYTELAPLNYSSPPWGQLVHASNGMLYGVTSGGDIFESDLAGNVTTLMLGLGFNGQAYPLIEASDGNLYGVTYNFNVGIGKAYRLTLAGVVTPIHTFTAAEGQPSTQLTEASDGNLYGISSVGIYRITTSGIVTVLQRLPRGEGSAAVPFTQALDGKLYAGMYAYPNALISINLDGTGFTYLKRVARDGSEALVSGLLLASDGNLYGATRLNGLGGGTLFEYALPGSYSLLTPFGKHNNDPFTPSAALIQGSDGLLYGTLLTGDDIGGAIYTFNNGLTPPVPLIEAFGPVSQSTLPSILIRGHHLLGASSVTFNGVPGAFVVRGADFITAFVPNGVKSGPIAVTTPTGTATSRANFLVR